MIVRDGDASNIMYQGSVMPNDMSSHNELMQQQQHRVSNNVPGRPVKKAGKLTAQVQPQVHQSNQYSNYSQYANAGILLQENAKLQCLQREHKLMHLQREQEQVNHTSVCGSHSEKHVNNDNVHHVFHRTPYEFLPLCDLLFNIISLAAYFCDVLFDVVRIFSIYSAILDNDPVVDNPAHRSMMPFMLILVIFSSIICQYLSLRWYARFWVTNLNSSPCCDKSQDVQNNREKHYASNSSSSSQQINLPVRCMDNTNNSNCLTAVTRKIRSLYHNHMSQISSVNWSTPGNFAILLAHFFQLGILWRYFRLFVPVNLLTVKHEVRDLVMLRMVHGFCEAGPMLLMQVYLMWIKESPNDIRDLEVISTFLSLFAVCWALASFNKNARRKNIHKLILTWLGVIFQFIWRIGMISSRIIALTVCAVVFREFVLAVIFLHWVCMCLWILSPWYLVSHETEKVSRTRKFIHAALLGYVYIFCFINWYDSDVRPKMLLFYFIIFIENTLLVSLSLSPLTGSWFYQISILLVWGGFAIGLVAMILYYKFFHIRFVKQSLGVVNMEYGIPVQSSDPCEGEGAVALNSHHQDKQINQSGRVSCTSLAASAAAMAGRTSAMASSSPPNRMDSGLSMPGVPGVFNCRLNPALKRKKKKPSTFPPPPTTTSPTTRSLLAKHQSPVPFSDQPPTQQSSVMKVTNDSSTALAVSDSDNVNAPSDEAMLSQAATGNIQVDGIRNFASFHRPVPAPRSRSALSPSFDTTTGQMTQRQMMERREKQLLIERQLQLHQRRIRGSAPYLPTLHNDQPPSIMRLNRVPPIPTSKRPPIHFFRSAAASMEAQNRMNQRLASGGAMSVPTVPTVSSRYGVTGSKHHGSSHYQYYHNPSARLHRQRMKYRSQTPEVLMANSAHMTTGRIGSRIYHDFPGYVISSPPPLPPTSSIPGFFTPQVNIFKSTEEEPDRTTTSSSCSSDDDATGCRSKRQHLYYEAEQFSDRHFHPLKFQNHHHRTHHYSKIKLSHASRIPPHLPATNETSQRTDHQTKPLNTEQVSTSLKTVASSQPEIVVSESHANQIPQTTLLPDVAVGTATADSINEVRPESSSELVKHPEPTTGSVRSSVRALVSSFEENRKSVSGPVPGLESQSLTGYRASLLVPSCKRSRKPIRIASLENEASVKNNSSSDADIDSDLNVEEQK